VDIRVKSRLGTSVPTGKTRIRRGGFDTEEVFAKEEVFGTDFGTFAPLLAL